MIDPSAIGIGPLVGPECRRAIGRGWLIVVRTIAAFATMIVAASTSWFCGMSAQYDPYFQPFEPLTYGAIIVEGLLVATALVMGPALMAGSLAGEKERGAMGLLLATRVNALEIVLGRISAKFSQVAMLLIAGIPALVIVAAGGRLRAPTIATLIALPLAVAFGGAGLGAAASSVARRGRDALFAVYMILFLLLLGPYLASSLPIGEWVASLNPFSPLSALIWSEDRAGSLRTAVAWASFGVVGVAIAAWRLRPTSLRQTDGSRRSARRLFRVPPLSERPMLWKELYIERAGSVGQIGHWIYVAVLVVLVAAGVVEMVGAVVSGDGASPDWRNVFYTVGTLVANSSILFMCLVQCTIGLRAAVAIASERERGTWDGLLTSPLEGREIVVGKLWGSLHALRWLILAACWAWLMAWVGGYLSIALLLVLASHTLFVGAFMAAVGVRTSLATGTATKSMSVTVGIWLLTYFLSYIVAGIVSIVWLLLGMIFLFFGTRLGLIDSRSFPRLLFTSMGFVFLGGQVALFFLATLFIVSETRARFDRLAGRIAGGELAVAVDRLLHGGPPTPVLLDDLEVVDVGETRVDGQPPSRAAARFGLRGRRSQDA